MERREEAQEKENDRGKRRLLRGKLSERMKRIGR